MNSRPNLDTLQGLLRFAVENTKSEDAPNISTYEGMDPDRKQFLDNALKSLTVDIIQELENAITILESETATNDDKLKSLEVVEEYACDLDLSNSFLKIGGSRIVMKCLNSNDPRMRSAAAVLLAEITQNNNFGQKHFTDLLVIPKLINLLDDKRNTDVVRNSLHAISCLVREYEPALSIFIEKNGLENVLLCLKLNDDRTITKASFLLSTISTEFPLVRDELIKLGAVHILCECLMPNVVDGEYNAKLENILSALNVLTHNSQLGEVQFKAVTNIKQKLENIVEHNENLAESEEIVMYSKDLLKFL